MQGSASQQTSHNSGRTEDAVQRRKKTYEVGSFEYLSPFLYLAAGLQNVFFTVPLILMGCGSQLQDNDPKGLNVTGHNPPAPGHQRGQSPPTLKSLGCELLGIWPCLFPYVSFSFLNLKEDHGHQRLSLLHTHSAFSHASSFSSLLQHTLSGIHHAGGLDPHIALALPSHM